KQPARRQGSRRGRDYPDRRPDGQRHRQCVGLVRGDAAPAATLACPRLAHGYSQTIDWGFGMTVDRSGDPPAPEPVLRRVKISIGAERRTHRGNLRAGGVPRARKTKTRILERKLQKARDRWFDGALP